MLWWREKTVAIHSQEMDEQGTSIVSYELSDGALSHKEEGHQINYKLFGE